MEDGPDSVRKRAIVDNRAGVFFFFQAEDGIRDLTVTGVQTCALPISLVRSASCRAVPALPCSGRPARGGGPGSRRARQAPGRARRASRRSARGAQPALDRKSVV